MSTARPFNSPLECGLRTLTLLAASHPSACDLQRLIFYDYLLVHSGDVPGGPESIHPATPLRSGEALVRRHWIEKGLLLMLSRELLKRKFSPAGITYQASPLTGSFLDYMEQPYTKQLRERAQCVVPRQNSIRGQNRPGSLPLMLFGERCWPKKQTVK